MFYFKVFLLGFLVAPLGDYFHVLSETIGYPAESYLLFSNNIPPIWVPFLFGTAALLVVFFHLNVYSRFRLIEEKLLDHIRMGPHTVIGLAILLVSYCISGYMPWNGGGNELILGMICFLTWYLFNRTFLGFVLGVITGVIGTIVEWSLMQADLFYYYERVVFNTHGFPYWLPCIYFLVSIAMTHFSLTEVKINKKLFGTA